MKAIQENRKKRNDLLTKTENTVEFIVPAETETNKEFQYGIPIIVTEHEDGRKETQGLFGRPVHLYFPKEKIEELHSIFNDFGITEKFHADLTLAYASMHYQNLQYPEMMNHFNTVDATCEMNLEVIKALENIAKGLANINSIKIEYCENNSDNEISNIKIAKSSPIVKMFFDAMKCLVEKEEFIEHKLENINELSIGPALIYGTHKNVKKELQYKYAKALLNYCNYYISTKELTITNYSNDYDKYKGKFNNNVTNIYYFIGKLMIHSGLLTLIKNDKDIVVDVMRKKLKNLNSNVTN